jgi:Flp pilus assembly protein TadD
MSKPKSPSQKFAPQVRLGTPVPWGSILRVWGGLALIVLVVCFAYLPSLNGKFILDDDKLLTNNSLIKAPDGLYRFWCSTESIDYWPISNSTLWIEWRMWGMNPMGYHVANLVLHIVAVLLIWLVLRKLSIPGAYLAAMLFAVHPVNVESVAWIASRKNLLSMVFFLLSIFWYLKADMTAAEKALEKDTAPIHHKLSLFPFPWYWLSLLAFVLAMLGKGSVAILPLLLLGITWWQRKFTLWDLVRTAPFFLIGAVLAGINVWFQTHGTGAVVRTAGFVERLLGAGGAIWFYLYKALLPLDLSLVYPMWQIKVDNLFWWLPLIAAVVVSAVLWWNRSGWGRPFLFAWGFFCASLIPVMGFADVGFMEQSLVADRYQYIPIIGVIALAAAGWDLCRRRLQWPGQLAAIGLAVAMVGVLMFLTRQQSGLFSEPIALYQDALKKNPNSWMAHNNFGVALDGTGRGADERRHYREALRLKPNYPDAHNNLGAALIEAGRPEESIEHFQEALKLQPDYAEAHNNLSVALIQTNRPDDAIKHCQEALRIEPNYTEAYNNLGNALIQTGRAQEAMAYIRRALQLNPAYADAHCNLGIALEKLDQPQDAIVQLLEALRLRPAFPEAYAFLALSYAKINRPDAAEAAAQKALQLARSQGLTRLAGEVESWLKSYRAGLRSFPDVSPRRKGVAWPP